MPALSQAITGALYGLYVGLALSWFASSVGQALAFLLGRYLFRASVKAYLLQRVPNFPQIVSGARGGVEGALQLVVSTGAGDKGKLIADEQGATRPQMQSGSHVAYVCGAQ